MKYENIKRYNDLDFESYLKLNGFSNSFLQKEINGISRGVIVSESMKVGSMVDAILTEPNKVDVLSPYYETGRGIAKLISKEFGDLLSKFEKQKNFSSEIVLTQDDFEYRMLTKGRLDFSVQGEAVIDLKVTKSTNISSLVDFMGYKDQLFNYKNISQAKNTFLIIHSRTLKKTNLFHVDCSEGKSFWEEKVLKFGTVKKLN